MNKRLDKTTSKDYCSFTVLMKRSDREIFKKAVMKKGYTMREYLPILIKQWSKTNTK